MPFLISALLCLTGQTAFASVQVCTSSNNLGKLGKLVADVDSRNSSYGARIPLILIHGIHGTDSTVFNSIDGSTPGEKEYFKNLINYFYNSDLKDKYQLYRYHYLSDQQPVTNIAAGLQGCLDSFIDKRIMRDTEIVILAHSMGGLVARSYMQERVHTKGIYANQYGGERVEKLITLATPHHGSPGANKCTRDQLATDFAWLAIMESVDLYYWKWKNGVDSPKEPNRSDLRFDNWDETMNPVGYDSYCDLWDRNNWLISLNNLVGYDNKTIAYAGYIDPNDPVRISLVNGGPLVIADFIVEQANNEGEEAIAASIALNEGLMGLYGVNDGMVPLSSARYTEHDTVERRDNFIRFDHGEMKGDRLLSGDGKYELLFETLNQDLNAIYNSTNVSTIIAVEYFIDTDPGEGAGVGMNLLGLPSDTVMFPNISTSNLTVGLHTLYIRTLLSKIADFQEITPCNIYCF
jgi:pimeloyl-ACP methyl ester carboxylesterase